MCVGGKVNFDDLNSDKAYDPSAAYDQSKLCNVLFTRELAKRLSNTEHVTVNSLHPGVVRTELGRHLKDTLGWKFYLMFIFYPILLWLMKSPRQGAQTTIHCAVSEELNNVTGLYFSDCQPMEPSKLALNDDDAKKLWQISEKLCKLNTK